MFGQYSNETKLEREAFMMPSSGSVGQDVITKTSQPTVDDLDDIGILIQFFQEIGVPNISREGILDCVGRDRNYSPDVIHDSQLYQWLTEIEGDATKLEKKFYQNTGERLAGIVRQIYKCSAELQVSIISQLHEKADFFENRSLDLNDPKGDYSVYSEILQCEKSLDHLDFHLHDRIVQLKYRQNSPNTFSVSEVSVCLKERMVDFLRELMLLEKGAKMEIHKRSGRTLESFNSTIRFPAIPSAIYEINARTTLAPEGRHVRQWLESKRQALEDFIGGKDSNKRPHPEELHRTIFRLSGPADVLIAVYHDQEFPYYAKISIAPHLSTASTEILEQETFLSAFGSYYYVRKFQSAKPISISLSEAEKLIKTRPAVPDPNKRIREIVSEIELLKDEVIKLLGEREDDFNHLLTDLITNRLTQISPEACKGIDFPQLKTIIRLYQEIDTDPTIRVSDEILKEKILKEVLLEANYLRRVSKERAEREKSISVSRVMNLLNQGFSHVTSVVDRDLVMFWGGTGAGKSTSINFYLGHELEPWEESYGKKGLKLSNEKDLKRGSFAKIGESIAVSETAFVHGYPLMENVLRQLNRSRVLGGQDLTLCDCPGFDDTRGIEYDLCTALSVQQAIRKSRSIKAVVLTLPYSALEVNKGNLAIELFENLSNTIQLFGNKDPRESINARRSIFLLITKFPRDLKAPEEAIRQRVAQSLQEQEAQEGNRSAGAGSVYLQKRTEIWRLINEVCSSRLLVFRYDDNCRETIKSFLGCPGIDKRLFQNTMERPDIQSQFGSCLETSFGTWKTTILDRYHRGIPAKILEKNGKIDKVKQEIASFNGLIQEKENLFEQTKKTVQVFQEDKKILQGLTKPEEICAFLEKRKKQSSEEETVVVQGLRQKNKLKQQELALKVGELKDKEDSLKNYEERISLAKEKISALEQEKKQLMEGSEKSDMAQHVYHYSPNDKLILRSVSEASKNRAFNEVRPATAAECGGIVYDGLVKDYSGTMLDHITVSREYRLTPLDQQQREEFLRNSIVVDTTIDKKFAVYFEGKNATLQRMNATPDGKKMLYEVVSNFQAGREIPDFHIWHEVPNMVRNEATILEKEAEIKAAERDITEDNAETNRLNTRINELKIEIEKLAKVLKENDQQIEKEKKKRVSEDKTGYLKECSESTKQLESAKATYQSEIAANKKKIKEKEEEISKVYGLELEVLQRERRDIAVIIWNGKDLAHNLREIAGIGCESIGFTNTVLKSAGLESQLRSYAEFYDENFGSILQNCAAELHLSIDEACIQRYATFPAVSPLGIHPPKPILLSKNQGGRVLSVSSPETSNELVTSRQNGVEAKRLALNTAYQYEDNDIQAILTVRLKQLRAQNPALIQPIEILAAVDNIAGFQLENRLRQEAKRNKGTRMLLIPCNLGNAHWVGILLLFSADGQISRVEYLDSLKPAALIPIVPQTFQAQLQAVYPNAHFETRILLQQSDGNSCGAYTVENLLTAALGIASPEESGAIRHLHLEALRQYNPDFYSGFNERQRNNRPTIANLQEQLGHFDRLKGIWFSKPELNRILAIKQCLSRLPKETQAALLQAFKPDLTYTDEHDVHLNIIRIALQEALKLEFKVLAELMQLLFENWRPEDSLALDRLNFRVSYNEILAVTESHLLPEQMSNLQKTLVEQIKQDEEFARKLQEELWNCPAVSFHLPNTIEQRQASGFNEQAADAGSAAWVEPLAYLRSSNANASRQSAALREEKQPPRPRVRPKPVPKANTGSGL